MRIKDKWKKNMKSQKSHGHMPSSSLKGYWKNTTQHDNGHGVPHRRSWVRRLIKNSTPTTLSNGLVVECSVAWISFYLKYRPRREYCFVFKYPPSQEAWPYTVHLWRREPEHWMVSSLEINKKMIHSRLYGSVDVGVKGREFKITSM